MQHLGNAVYRQGIPALADDEYGRGWHPFAHIIMSKITGILVFIAPLSFILPPDAPLLPCIVLFAALADLDELLINALLSLREQGHAYAIIGGVNEAAGFYERTVHASRIPGSEQHSIYAHMGISF
jgi:hypothetical protein